MWLTHFWHSWSQFFIFAWDVTAGGILRTGVLICLVSLIFLYFYNPPLNSLIVPHFLHFPLFLFSFFHLRPVLGIVIACVCLWVRQSWACLRDHSSQDWARITKSGPKNAKYFAYGPCCFWYWLGLTFQVKFYFIEKFCLFASLLHLWNICETRLSNCSTSHMAPHT